MAQGSPAARRSSYGPTSPRVGQRGARTLDAILGAALATFAERGFHESTMQDIADGVGAARATVYQYFESKEAIFVELLEECGAAVVDVVKRLDELGPTAEGFSHLRWWLGEWASVYDRYSTLFMEWSTVDYPGAPVGALVGRFNASFTHRVAGRLGASGVTGVDLEATASVLTGVILRANYMRTVGTAPKDDDLRRGYYFAVVLQLMLFPDTPVEALRGGRSTSRTWFQSRIAGRFVPREVPAIVGVVDPLDRAPSARSVRTVQALMAAGARAFAERGYQRTNVDEIVTATGVARGTFYKYFDSKAELLLALADRCRRDSVAVVERLGRVDLDPAAEDGFATWVAAALELGDEYRGVYRIWMERGAGDEQLQAMRHEVVEKLRRSMFIALSALDLDHPADLRTCEVFLVSMLDQVPEAFELSSLSPTRAQQVELIETLLRRGLLGEAASVS